MKKSITAFAKGGGGLTLSIVLRKALNIVICIVLLYILIYSLFKAYLYLKFQYMIYKANPYVTSSFTPSPVLEEDALSLTWIIHKYVPLHNAGSEWMAHAINTYLIQNQGFHVNVITNTTPVDEFERVRISVRGALSTNEHVLRHCSVILSHHTQEPNAIKTAYLVKRPIVCLMHDHGRTNFLEEYAALPYKHNIYLINNSQWLEKYYAKHGFQSIIVHPPVYWQEYQTETTHEYVTLINCNMNKGGRLLVEIAKRMHDVEFLGVKGAYNKQYTTKGIQNLTYMDQTPYIKSVYGKTDILLMPSKEESWGRTAIEAMSSGIPVIAHPTPGLLESCGEAGIFCDRDDINAWIDAIRRLKTDKEYYNSVSEKCRARAKELDPEPQLRKLSSWLKSLTWKE